MPKTSNVFARVEPELKEQAEAVLNQIGLPLSNAITIFLRQVVLKRGIPFSLTLPQKPKALGDYCKDEFDAKIQRAFDDATAGKGRPMEEAFAEMERKYAL